MTSFLQKQCRPSRIWQSKWPAQRIDPKRRSSFKPIRESTSIRTGLVSFQCEISACRISKWPADLSAVLAAEGTKEDQNLKLSIICTYQLKLKLSHKFVAIFKSNILVTLQLSDLVEAKAGRFTKQKMNKSSRLRVYTHTYEFIAILSTEIVDRMSHPLRFRIILTPTHTS